MLEEGIFVDGVLDTGTAENSELRNGNNLTDTYTGPVVGGQPTSWNWQEDLFKRRCGGSHLC